MRTWAGIAGRVALAAAAVVATGGCTKPFEPEATFVSTSNIKGFDPVDSGGLVGSSAQSQVYEGLYEYEYLKRPLELRNRSRCLLSLNMRPA